MSGELDRIRHTIPAAAGLAETLLGCEWGHGKIGGIRDEYPVPCSAQAVQIIVLHSGGLEFPLKLCALHRNIVLAETSPHED